MHNRFDKLVPGLQNKIQLAVDLVLLGASFLLTITRWAPDTLKQALPLIALGSFAWLFAAGVTRLYSPCTPRRMLDNLVLRAITVLSAAATMLLASGLGGFLPVSFDFLSFILLFYILSAVGGVVVFKPLRRIGRPVQEVMIVGVDHFALATYQRLTSPDLQLPCHVVGFVSVPGQTDAVSRLPVQILGSVENLTQILENNPVSEVYVALRVTKHGDLMQELVTSLERIGMPFALPLHALIFERAQLASSSPARDGYLHYLSTAWKPAQYALKRLMDIMAAAAGLIILSPLLMSVALIIKMTSRGPVLFKQRRVGLHGATFDLLKFRSMVVNAEALKEQLMEQNEQSGPVFKMKNDPRITAIGRFIRKYSIDELPQLINILRGDMTIVGPRPALPQEVTQYQPWQRRRLSVRPGLTCYWQVGGRNGITFEEWMRLDLQYVDNWSLGVDVQLILQTVPAVLAGRGAS